MRFNPGALEIVANDRLRAPNEPATYEAFQPILDDLARALYGDAAITVVRPSDRRARFGVSVSGPAATVDEALARLA
ncbi:MAG: hypothetical protein U0802_22155 [Candidatus Binatia bacterium]